ncbi:MAG: hypothetical protein M3282_11725, partial [Gemmatimonadota bacterium]|nr:hypothetical protein [Gemmatimonadota bacterium]
MNRQVKLRLLLALVAAVGTAPSLPAQAPEPRPTDTSLFSRRDAVAAGIATAATLVVAAFDRSIAESVSDSTGRVQRSSFLGARAENFNHVNEQSLTLGGLALYG